MILAMLSATLVALARPWPMQVIVDSVLGNEPAPVWIHALLGAVDVRARLLVLVASMSAAILVGGLLALGQQYGAQLLGQRMVLRLRCDLYGKVQRLALRFHDRSSVGDLV